MQHRELSWMCTILAFPSFRSWLLWIWSWSSQPGSCACTMQRWGSWKLLLTGKYTEQRWLSKQKEEDSQKRIALDNHSQCYFQKQQESARGGEQTWRVTNPAPEELHWPGKGACRFLSVSVGRKRVGVRLTFEWVWIGILGKFWKQPSPVLFLENS